MTEDRDMKILTASLDAMEENLTAALEVLRKHQKDITRRVDGDFLVIPLGEATALRGRIFAASINAQTVRSRAEAIQPSLF